MHTIATGELAGVPYSVFYAVVLTAIVGFAVKRTVAGRRFEAVGDNPAAATMAGLRPHRHQTAAYIWATLLYCTAGILLGGIITTPSSFQGDSQLLPSVAAVVLGGTSLLGGKGSPVASAIAALFLSQLDQFVLTLGVNPATSNIVQALSLGAGVAVYAIRWSAVRDRLRRLRSRSTPVEGRHRPRLQPLQRSLRFHRAPSTPSISGRVGPVMSAKYRRHAMIACLGLLAMAASACSVSEGGSGSTGSGGGGQSGQAANASVPSWCGSKKVSLGLADGFGDNNWRQVTSAEAKEEIAKCPNVTSYSYTDGQGNTQKAISDIQGLVAKGVQGLVRADARSGVEVFPQVSGP